MNGTCVTLKKCAHPGVISYFINNSRQAFTDSVFLLLNSLPHFYTGYETALHRVSRYLRDRNAPVSTLRHRMWRDMAERVAERRKKNPKLTISQAVIDVIDEEDAPSFYLSFFSGRRAYFRYKALRRSERGHRLGRRSLF